MPRIYTKFGLYAVTFSTYERYPYFSLEKSYSKLYCDLFVVELNKKRLLKEFNLNAFAILPDHIHLLIQVHEKFNISEVMFSLKKNFSHNVNRIILEQKFKWNKSFYDHLIRKDKDYENQYGYIVGNPSKHGLPDDYAYTSESYPDIIDCIS